MSNIIQIKRVDGAVGGQLAAARPARVRRRPVAPRIICLMKFEVNEIVTQKIVFMRAAFLCSAL